MKQIDEESTILHDFAFGCTIANGRDFSIEKKICCHAPNSHLCDCTSHDNASRGSVRLIVIGKVLEDVSHDGDTLPPLVKELCTVLEDEYQYEIWKRFEVRRTAYPVLLCPLLRYWTIYV